MKKILVIGPALADWSEIKNIETAYQFLNENFKIDFIDPLKNIDVHSDQSSFFDYWKHEMKILYQEYDVFFGMSLGGVILQQCFDLFQNSKKPIVFFSVPSFSDYHLSKNLKQVIHLIQTESVFAGIEYLNQTVFYPHLSPMHEIELEYPERAAFRLSFGFQVVCHTDSRSILKKSEKVYLHLIGERSKLVNNDNVFVPESGQLVIVPNAGMRVLQNNLEFCKEPIIQFLKNQLQLKDHG